MEVTIANPSVMSLLILMRVNENLLATGTAFLIRVHDRTMLITNRHNVTGRRQDDGQPISPHGGVPDEIVIMHNRKDQLGQWVGKIEPLYSGDQPRWYEHPTLGSAADFVALPLSQLEDIDIFPYNPSNPGPDIQIGPAEAVSVVGFPFGMSVGGALAVWATGFIATEPGVDYNDLPAFLIDCRARQGQSGSAVIAYRSKGTAVSTTDGNTVVFREPVFRFLGIYSGRINTESDLGIVWKATAIAELINYTM